MVALIKHSVHIVLIMCTELEFITFYGVVNPYFLLLRFQSPPPSCSWRPLSLFAFVALVISLIVSELYSLSAALPRNFTTFQPHSYAAATFPFIYSLFRTHSKQEMEAYSFYGSASARCVFITQYVFLYTMVNVTRHP